MKALLQDAWRGVGSRRGAMLVTVGGLSLALAVCVLLGLFFIALSSTDPGVAAPERVVMLDFKGNPPGQPGPWFSSSPVSFGPMLKARHVPMDFISRTSWEAMTVRMQGTLQLMSVLAADPDLVPLMNLKALHGDLWATLNRNDVLAITPATVRKLWGELPLAQAIGRTIESRGKAYTVTAVIPALDPRSPLGVPDAMAGYAMVGKDLRGNIENEAALNAIYMANGRVYGRLRAGSSVDQVAGWMHDAFVANPLYAQLPTEWKTGREAAYFRGLTLTELPFKTDDNALRWTLLAAVGAASLLLLILAAFNTMNLQAANLLQRQRETALRRALGASSAQLLGLWALEALLPLLLCAGVALLLAWWLAPAVANWLDLPPGYPVADPIPLPALLGLGLTVLLLWPLTLTVPAWLALRRRPAAALQGRTASEGPWGRRLRQGLLMLQLAGALLLLSMTGVMAIQHQHLLHADRGFQTHNRLVLSAVVENDQVPNLDAFMAALSKQPAIQHWAFSSARPAMDTGGPTELHVSGSQHKQLLRMTTVTPGYFATYGMQLLAGNPQTGVGEAHVVLDAKAAQALGFARPQAAVGALLTGGGGWLQAGNDTRRVVAVVGDVKQESAREPAMPQGFLLSDKPQWDLTVYGPDIAKLRQALEQTWQTYGPPVLHRVWTADEQRAIVYRQEEQLTTTLAVVATLAIGVAMLGAYALVADTLRRRRTELVLHRLHGAGHAAIARQVAAEFTWPLLLAGGMSLPLAALLGGQYLAGFFERADGTVGLALPLLLAGGVLLLVVAAAALRHTRLALALRPIEALH